MIITRLYEGIGNQLFQYALGKSLANKLNVELKCDALCDENGKPISYLLDNFNVKVNFATPEEIAKVQARYKNLPRNPGKEIMIDDWTMHFQPEILNLPDNTYLEGIWTTESYFKDISDQIREEFTLKNPLGENSAKWKEKILSTKCSVSLHVRLNDFLFTYTNERMGILPKEYYSKCVDELKKVFPDLKIFVFSNSLELAEKMLDFDVPMEFVSGCERDSEEIYLMSLCQHNIIGNSTFSWWGAWLNKNPDKKIFAPDPWFRMPGYNFDIIPESWIKIPVKFPKSPLPPALSVIVYVDGNFEETEKCLQSIESQFFKNYEVIFVCDKESDIQSVELCQNFVLGKDDFVLIKQRKMIGKIPAWNLGLDNASGDHIIFITSKNTIKPKTVRSLCSVLLRVRIAYVSYDDKLNNVYETHFAGIKKTTDFSNSAVDADVVSSVDDSTVGNETKLLEAVNIVYKDYLLDTGKKFIPLDSRLRFLASGGVNSSVKTKFFKRKFLQENNIRFNESVKNNAEMLFMTECMLRSDDLIFISHVFVD